MRIFSGTPERMTIVQNSFIDQYMPHANGEFVKVYLYLLRCADSGREISLSSIADVLEHTEKDIQRALAYWEKQQLLSVKTDSDGMLVSVTFLAPPAVENRKKSVPAGNAPSRDRIASAREQQEIRQLFYVAEQYLQRPLTSAEQSDFIYYYDTLQFSTDLIEYLIEYSISKGSANRHYMRKIALGWAEAGISTVIQAKQETNLHNKNYFAVLNTFGIKGRGPAVPEQEIMSRWFNEYHFTIDMVLEACRRTIRQTHQPSFEYTDKILEHWHKNGITTPAAVNQLDLQRKEDRKKTERKPAKTAPGANRFHNFSQREYDYSQLEKQLLNQ
ncbi:MAG TPA: DnaD domain protein [Candidatus Choladousia intestinipullorum]|nr:DnaD domain protein [Candidatus Choladousia intestinipullorum]